MKKALDILIGTAGTCLVIFGYYEDIMIYQMQIAKMFLEVSTLLIRKLCGLRTRRGYHNFYAPPTLKLGSMLV